MRHAAGGFMNVRAALLGLIIALSVPLLRAADDSKDSLPPAKAILERYSKEIGGKTAFEKHKSQHITGTIEIPAQKITGKMEVFAARPNKLIMKISMPGLGDVTTGYNGEVGWMSTAMTGPMLLEGKMVEEVKSQADFDHALHDAPDYKVMEVLGREEFNGEDCYKLKLVHKSGFASTEYFSVKSGLQRGFTATQSTPFGPVEATTLVSDYKNFGELLLPARTVQQTSGIEQVMTIKEMDYDTVEPSAFELPPEVKTLIEQKKKTAAPAGADKSDKVDKASAPPAKKSEEKKKS
jgi:hypothetical protein